MERKEILEKIKETEEIVKEVNDEYRGSAFEVVLSFLLKNERIENGTSFKFKKEQEQNEFSNEEEQTSDGLQELAQKSNVSVEQLKDLIEIKEDGTVELLIKFDNKLEKEKQMQVAQCIIIVLEIVQKQDWVETTTLTKSVEHSGVSSSHLSRTLNENNRVFRSTGTGKGTKYKLTGPGRSETFELIKKLIEN